MFYSNETAEAFIMVENHDSKLAIKSVEFRVIQKIRIQHTWREYEVIENLDHTRIEPGQKCDDLKAMHLDFSKIKYTVAQEKRKMYMGHRITKPRTEEEHFLLSNLPPATHGRHI